MATRVQSQRGGALIGIRSHVSVYTRGALTLSCVPASDFCSFSAFGERCAELGAAIETEGDSKRSQKHQRHTREVYSEHRNDVRACAAEGKYYHVTPKRAWLNV